MTDNSTLKTHSLIKSYSGRRVVNQVSLEVRSGEIVGLLGPNGAGKTTSFYMCVGLVMPSEGSIELNGEDITRLPVFERARLGISYLPQEASVFRKLSVKENILSILETLPGLSKKERNDRLDQVVEELGLETVINTKGNALSGGERRRVEIGRALVRDPKFFLLDEPFAGIDPIAVKDIQEIISKLKKRGIGVLITDHNVRETLQICDRAYILVAGRVLEEGSPESIALSERAQELYLGQDFRL